jgi:hypothetical protein
MRENNISSLYVVYSQVLLISSVKNTTWRLHLQQKDTKINEKVHFSVETQTATPSGVLSSCRGVNECLAKQRALTNSCSVSGSSVANVWQVRGVGKYNLRRHLQQNNAAPTPWLVTEVTDKSTNLLLHPPDEGRKPGSRGGHVFGLQL